MKTLKLLIAIIAITLSNNLSAQSTGIIKGTLTDEKKNNMPFVIVALMEDSTIITSAYTDDRGDFTFKQLTPGLYNLQFSFTGFKTKRVYDIEVIANNTSYVYRSMVSSSDTLTTVVIDGGKWEKPVIDPGFSTVTKIDIEQIESIPTGKSDIISMITSLAPAVVVSEDGKDIHIKGSRQGTAGYYVDGNKMMGPAQVTGLSISGVEVLTDGMPAEYGDCTGGLVIITTKDYKMEMRRKQMAKTDRKEREEESKKTNN